MKTQPPTISLKRGSPVLYYEGSKPKRLYLGDKIGGYKTLSHNSACLDSGVCVPAVEFPKKVFPAPNEHNVFAREVCTLISFNVDRRLKIEVCFVQAGPAHWCAAVTEKWVGDRFSSSPVSLTHTHSSLHKALFSILPPLLKELRDLANSTDLVMQSHQHSLPKSMYGKARRFGREAVYALISAIPPEIASDILKSLNGVE
jgi:hypothetical protein